MITIYTSEEIEKIAAAGKLTADTLSMLEKAVRPGISTLELDEMAEKFIRSRVFIISVSTLTFNQL